jgi:hypothetical protein
MTPCHQVCIATLVLAVPLAAADDPRAANLNPELRKKWNAIPLPAKTPFDADVQKREGYLRSYRNGYFWAEGHHLWCPTNPQKHNLHAIQGWIEGWQAGVKAGEVGELPTTYASLLVWRGARPWRDQVEERGTPGDSRLDREMADARQGWR